MANISSLYYRYFVYSQEEEAQKIQVHGPNAEFGTVVKNGIPKRYTSIVKDMNDAKADAIVVVQGDIRKIRYNPPQK